MDHLFAIEYKPDSPAYQELLTTAHPRSFVALGPISDDCGVAVPEERKGGEHWEDRLDEESADFLSRARELVTAYQEIAAKSDESLAALRLKFAAPVRRVLYQDLESTIWRVWRVRGGDVTVNHIGLALNLIAGKCEGGVELDPASCDLCGIDYIRLMSLIRRSRVKADDISSGPKVPRNSAPALATGSPASEGAPSPIGKPDPAPACETGSSTASAPRKKAGRPAQISVASKEAALAAKEQNKSWKEVAKTLYDAMYPTSSQVKNAPNILKHYERTRVAHPNNS